MLKYRVSASSLCGFLPKLQLAKACEDMNNGNDDDYDDDDDDDDDNNKNCGRTKATDKQKTEYEMVKRLDSRKMPLSS
jgi:hypothetical protein